MRGIARGLHHFPARLTRSARIYAPREFDINKYAPRHELLKFLRALREIIVVQKASLTIDFSHTTKMWPGGTLLFLAEVKRVMHLTKGMVKISCRSVTSQRINQVLFQIGFYQTINRSTKVRPTADDVVHWRAVSGVNADGKTANTFVETFGGKLPEALNTPMYNGLVEAMTNSKQHAYLRARADGLDAGGNGEWWMFAQERDNKLTVAFCDLGIGIPNSLPLTQGKGRVAEVLAGLGRATGLIKDAHLIEAALELGRSRSGKSHRGKGLKDIVDVVEAAGTGNLQIVSNAGCFTHRVKDGKVTSEYSDLDLSILGTLIQWTVPIGAEEHVS